MKGVICLLNLLAGLFSLATPEFKLDSQTSINSGYSLTADSIKIESENKIVQLGQKENNFDENIFLNRRAGGEGGKGGLLGNGGGGESNGGGGGLLGNSGTVGSTSGSGASGNNSGGGVNGGKGGDGSGFSGRGGKGGDGGGFPGSGGKGGDSGGFSSHGSKGGESGGFSGHGGKGDDEESGTRGRDEKPEGNSNSSLNSKNLIPSFCALVSAIIFYSS